MADDRRVRSRSDANQEEERDWASLEPLENVAGRLNAVEFLAFAGTCERWRSLVKPLSSKILASQQPLLVLYHPGHQKIAVCCLSDGACYSYRCAQSYYDCVAYSHGYLIMLSADGRTTNIYDELDDQKEEEPKEIDVILYQPFTRREIRCFPIAKREIFRAILSAPPSSPECVIVAFSLVGDILMYCRPGDAEWKEFACPSEFSLHQVAIGRGKVYSHSEPTGLVMAFSNIFETNLAPTAEELPEAPIPAELNSMLLTNAEGDLYLVCLAVTEADEFYYQLRGKVYGDTPTIAFRYDEPSKEWLYVQSFGGQSAFFTWYGSMLTDLDSELDFPEEWKGSLCCSYPELGYYNLDTLGRENIEYYDHWQAFLIKEKFEREVLSPWWPSAYWVHPSLCYHE